jgi:uncharacterized Rossmann fold enzyme
MLTVACVKVGWLYPAAYVNTLYDMVIRNLQAGFPGRFVCFTDDATGLDPAIQVREVPKDLSDRGWWAKLWLFSKDAFPEGGRILYLDLDTVITGPLDHIAMCQSDFAMLRDPYQFEGSTLNSGIMAWEAGMHSHIWENWNAAHRPNVQGGDQVWIAGSVKADVLQDLYPGRLRSYKVECRQEIPKGTSIVFFHGHPRPHEVTSGWVPEVWKVGGGSGAEFIVQANVDDGTLHGNVRHALQRGGRWVSPGKDDRTAVIVGGGPSLKEHLHYIRGMQMSGAVVYATNNAYAFLEKHGIRADAHVMLDARRENLAFVPRGTCAKYYASQCHPEVLEAAGEDLICWHAALACYQPLIEREHPDSVSIGGGTTVGMKALALAYMLGHRHLRLFGFDSCYRESHHAYPQPLNDSEKMMDVTMGGEHFRCAPWMITQAEEFKDVAPVLVACGCTLRVYGDGLIAHLASLMKPRDVDERWIQLTQWLDGMKSPVGAEIGVFAGELSSRLLQRPDLTLYMVDSWREGDGGDQFHARLSQDQQDHFLGAARAATAFAGERAKIVVERSVPAAAHIPDASLDFVFIDADHTYEAVRADVLAWLPKVKPTGFIAGHDYENPGYPEWGVKQAVEEILGSVEVGANYCWRKAIEDLHEH